MDRILRDKKAILVFLLPGLLVFTFVVLIPVGWSLVYSLYEGVVGIQLDFTGLHNYTLLFRDPQFIRSMIITLKYALVVTSSQMILGLLFAFLFAYGVKYKTVVRTICFLPVVLPVVAVGQLFSKMYAIAPMYGLINSLLDLLGLGAYCKAWIGTTQTALAALCVQDIWMTAGFYAIIYYAGIVDIPGDLVEAAKIDGATGTQIAWRIILPLLRPVIATALIYSLSGSIKVYASAYALTGGGPARATYMLSMYMYDTAFKFSEYGYGSTIGVFIMLECLFFVLLTNYLVNRKDKTI